MGWTIKLIKVRAILSELYPTKDEMRRVIKDAGLSLQKLKFEGKGEDIWEDIITEAISRGKFNVLVENCIAEYREKKELKQAYQEYLQDGLQPQTLTDDYIPLPIQPTLIGRDEEIKEHTELMMQPEVRLLTLTGFTGIGKTALAKYLIVDLAKHFKDKAVFVELASLGDEGSLEDAIANKMPDYKRTIGVSILEFLREKHRLIVLDNFDAVISAAPQITELLHRCPQVKFLVTSQQPLATPDNGLMLLEHRRVVSPLSYPRSGVPGATVTAAESGAVQLFIARAEAIKGKGRLSRSATNMEAIVAICQAVNGLPLCIQIVASLINAYDLPKLLGFLQRDGFAKLDEEQQVSKAIDIRYANLTPAEKTLFARLAIFNGWCSFEAAREICRSVKGKSVRVTTTLPKLVDKSLVQSESGRYQMLQVIREYARGRLDKSEAALLRPKYATYYLKLAEDVAPRLKTPKRKEELYRLEQDDDNLRAVFDWSIGPKGNLQVGLSLAGALFWYWNFLAYFREGQQQVRRLLDGAASQKPSKAIPQKPSKALASALYCHGGLTFLLGEYRDAQTQLTRSVKVWRSTKDASGLAYTLIILGMVKKEIGEDLKTARQHEEKSVQLLKDLKDEWGHALALNDLGNVMVAQGEEHYSEARRSYDESKRKWEQLQDPWGLSLVLSNLSALDCKEQHYETAYGLMVKALKIQDRENDKWGRAWSLKGIGDAKLGLGDYGSAATNFYESFSLHFDLGRKQLVAECLEGLAKVAARLGQSDRAAYLIGAAEKLRGEAGSIYAKDKEYDALVNTLRQDLSSEMFENQRTEGHALPEEKLPNEVQSLFEEWVSRNSFCREHRPEHEGSTAQHDTLELESKKGAPYTFAVRITQALATTSPARSFEVTGPELITGLLKTRRYYLPDSGHNSYLDLFQNLARDFGTRVPRNRQPATKPAFKAKYHALLTENLAPGMLYGYGDPAVLRVESLGNKIDACYYIVVTSNDAPDSFPIIRSRDLTNWEFAGFVFPRGKKPAWAADGEYVSDFWAPEMHLLAGEFRVYFAARDRETRALSIGVATSSGPTGPFTPGQEPLLTGNTIDPHIFIDDDNADSAYLFWKKDNNDIWPSRLTQLLHEHPDLIAELLPEKEDQITASFIQTLWPWIDGLEPIERFFAQQVLIEAVTSTFPAFQDRLRKWQRSDSARDAHEKAYDVLEGMRTPVYAQRLSADGLALVGEPVKVIENDQPWEAHLIEGMWVVKNDGKYYLFYSGNDFSSRDYGIGIAIADSPLGPYTKVPEPLLGSTKEWSGPGHPSIALDLKGNPLLFFHAYFPERTGYKEFRALLAAQIQFEPARVLLSQDGSS